MSGPRGFALIIVVIAGVAIVAMATAIIYTAGASRILAVKRSSIESSAIIAEAGLERATAYVKAVVKSESDFDRLLDPTLGVNCLAPPAFGTGGTGLPRYSDDSVQAFDGKDWSAVPFNGGAYLTRFDDDADDADPDPQNFLETFTGNHPGGNCDEGPTFPGMNNPYRDRNRAVWVTVVGIFPGTDPATAQHKTLLRRYYIATEPTPNPVVHAGRDLEVNGDTFNFCSTLGDVAAVRDIKIGGNTKSCAVLHAGNSITPGGVTPGDPACTPKNLVDCGPPGGGGTGVIPVSAPAVMNPVDPTQTPDNAWFDFTSPCNFYVSSQGGANSMRGLYWWDASGTRGGVPCNNPGLGAAVPAPPPSNNMASLGACWAPLVVINAIGNLPMPGQFVGVSSAFLTNSDLSALPVYEFTPHGGGGAGATYAVPAMTFPANPPFNHALAGVTYPTHTKPDWALCTGGFAWPPGSPGPPVTTPCTACTGANGVLKWDVPTQRWRFTAGASDRRALPTGVYFFDDPNVDLSTWNLGAPPPAANGDRVRADWPAITVITARDADTNGGSGVIGTGRVARGLMIGLVVGRDLDVTGGGAWAIAGALQVGRDLKVSGATLDVYGVTRAVRDIKVSGGGAFNTFYDLSLDNSSNVSLSPTPMYSRTIP